MSTADRSAEQAAVTPRLRGGAAGQAWRGSTDRDWLALGGVAALGVAATTSPDAVEDGPVLCPFRLITGVECPGCGLVRAWVYAVHGQWGESLAAHPLGLLSVLAVAVFALLVIGRRFRDAR